ncbi:efflux RND transporter periplasmic adaptor subunit [Microcoleus sp. FACHB-1515]|uniref:efflux RND transporter periplasmic adaptor subunit n=1 Tax=Cyanophyceae TaxID=3028117 RepID=UPI0028C38C7C|nr:efflux RND transporter periplasmic adaptor subunit [Microcoleus sp. FACHB-1515]
MPQSSKRAGVNWLIGSGVLAIVSIGGWWVYAVALNRPANPLSVRLLTVERGTVETTINESGTVELGNQQTLSSPAEGAVDRVLVQPGDTVRQGQILLTLRNPDRQTALVNQQIQIAQQQVTLSRSRQQIAEAQAQLTANQRRRATLLPLAREGAIPQTQIQDIEDQIRTTIAALNTAQAEARTAALELQSLQLEQQRIEQELQGTVVTAPTSGVILGVSVKDGDGVDRRTELLTLGNPAQELVQLQLSTLNAAQVQPNQPARVSVIGANPQIYTARIQSLYPQAIAPAEADSSEQASATVPTTVRLDRPTRRLIPGSQVNVEIVLEQRQNVVAIDIEAIQQAEANPFVWVMNGDQQVEQRSIDLGLEGLTSVEVRSGLRPGEQVVLPTPDQTLEPGMQVSPAEES